MRKFFTSESVTEGHPDKVADQISDAVLDSILEHDPNGRVACETFLTTGMVVICGEISTECYIDLQAIARKTICEIGYDNSDVCFDGNACAILTSIDEQSNDIAMGTNDNVGGAGDQGMMFGYACDDTEEYMPLPIYLAHKLTRRLAEVRKSGELSWLCPDGKSQVTVEYDNGTPVRIDAVVLSTQHNEDIDIEELRKEIKEKVIIPMLPADMLDDDTKYHINPTGRFVKGGPAADTGLTGRKIIVDTYGGMARHGGGAFSGKDATKVDRSAAYMARYLAKNIVAAGLARECEIQLAYAIGVADPVSVYVDTFGTGKIDDEKIADFVIENFDMCPLSIIERFDLRRPIFKKTATYGHFGDPNFPWEQLDSVKIMKKLL